MAKTQLSVGAEGFEALGKAMDEVIAKGDQISLIVKETTETSTKGAQQAALAQRQFAQEVLSGAKSYGELAALSKFALDTIKKDQAQIRKDVQSVNDLIAKRVIAESQGAKQVKDLAGEYAALEEEARQLQDALIKIASIEAPKVVDDGDRAKLKEEIGLLAQMESRIDLLQQKRVTVTDPDELARTNDELRDAVAAYDELSESTKRSAENLSTQAGLVAQVSAEIKALSTEQANATTSEELEAINVKLIDARDRLKELKTAGTIDTSGLEQVNDALGTQVGLIKSLESEIDKLTLDQKSASTAEELADVNQRLAQAKAAIADLKKEGLPELTADEKQIVAPVLGLRAQVQQATKEAEIAKQTFGEFSPEFEAARERAGRLKDEMGDVRKAIDQIQPEEKLKAVGDIAQTIAGGFSAVQGVLTLTGNASDDTAEKLLKIQSTLAVVQGVQSFFTSFAASIKAVNIWLRAAAVSSGAYAASQEGAVVVTAASTAANTANTAATNASAAATGRLATGVRTLTTVMAANPILLAATVLIGIAAALVALGDDAQDTAEKAGLVVEKLEQIQAFNERSTALGQRRADIEAEIKALERGNDVYAQRALIEEKAANQSAKTRAEIISLFENEQQIRQRIADLEGTDNEDELAALKEYEAQLSASIDKRKQLNEEGELANLELQRNVLAFEQEQAEKAAKEEEARQKESIRIARENAKERLRIEADYLKAVEELAEKVVQGDQAERIAELEVQADRAAKNGQIEEERKFRDEILGIREEQEMQSVDLMQRGLQERLAKIELEKRIGVQAIKELNDEQLQARLDGIIAEGQAELQPEQTEQLEILRNQVSARFQRERTENAVAESEKRIAQEQKELAEAIQIIDQRESLVNAQLDNAEGDGDQIMAILEQNGIEQEGVVRSAEEAKLMATIEFSKRRIAQLEASGDIENAVAIEKLKKLITDSQTELNTVKKFSWQKLLGVSDEEFAVIQQSLQQLGQFANQAIANFFAGARDENATLIAQLEERIAITQDAIDREQAAREQGLANNLDQEKANLQELQKQKEEAQREADKIAKKERDTQLVIQGANLLTAISRIIADGTLKGGVLGLAIASASIPFLYSLFNSAKGKVKEATGYVKGTPWLERNGNPKGVDTIPINGNEGERIVSTDENEKFWDVFEGIRRRDGKQLAEGLLSASDEFDFLDQLKKALGVEQPKITMPVNLQLPERINEGAKAAEQARFDRFKDPEMLRLMEEMARTNAALLHRELTKENRVYKPNGDLEIEQNGNIKTIRKG